MERHSLHWKVKEVMLIKKGNLFGALRKTGMHFEEEFTIVNI